MRSLLPIIAAADNFPPHSGLYPTSHPLTSERYVPFHLTFSDHQRGLAPVGLLRPAVLGEMLADERDAETCPWQFHHVAVPLAPLVQSADTAASDQAAPSGDGESMDVEEMELELQVECVFLADWVVRGGKETMGRVMNETAVRWRDAGKFSEALGGWRNEHYAIYADPSSSALPARSASAGASAGASADGQTMSNAAFPLERAACAVFGLATFGVHMTAYEGEGEGMKIWVPRRSATKATFPSKLDQSVAGGIVAGMTPFETLVKECDEEASLPESLVRSRANFNGVVTYFYITPGGYLQPGKYTYDLQLPPSDSEEYVRPHPHDDEVESFALLTIPQVLEALHTGEFKPNCGLILVDFLIRHGLVTPENEPNLIEIRWRTARRLGVAMPV